NGQSQPPSFNDPLFDVRVRRTNESTGKQRNGPPDRDTIIKSMRGHLIEIGTPQTNNYSGHSFRKGGAQSLAEANVASDTIQAMVGRWSSDCYKLYISTPNEAI